MKKLFALSALFVCTVAMNAVAQQSVADAARKAAASRKADPNRKVIDNDVVPAMIASTPDNSGIATEPANARSDKAAAPASPADAKDKASADAKDKAGKDAKGKDEAKLTPAEEQKKTADSWKKKVDDQKKEIAQLQRELDVAEREARLRAAAYAADAGVMLRDQEKFANDSRKSQAEIDGKRQALADAQQKLQEVQEQARKSGVPVGQVE